MLSVIFFLKDITHHHQHHDPSTDTIVDIYKTQKNDDISWRSKTLRVLLKKIYQCKRDHRSNVLTTSFGTLAYAKSFRKNFEKQGSNKILHPTFNDVELEQSIKARQDDLSFSIQKRIRNSESFRNLFFGSLGVLITLSSLLKLVRKDLKVEPSPILTFLAEFLVQNTIYSAVILAIFIFSSMVVTGAIDILNWPFIRGLMRVLQVYRLKIAVTMASFLGTLLLFLACLLVV